MGSLFLFISGGLGGIVHVLIGPDHLAAVAPFTSGRRIKAWLSGLWWGIGHTTGIWLTGLLLYLLHDWLPLEALSHWSERLVGVVLIALGIWGIRRALGSHLHYHTHEHDGKQHAHFHVHDSQSKHPLQEQSAHEHRHGLLSIGLLHGLAGSSHLIGLLPALTISSETGVVLYIGGFGIGAILAMASFSWFIGAAVERLSTWSANSFRYLQLSFSGFAILVGAAWLFIM